ncbi:hypothetical protein DMUE_4352 [Dictyocoela muelleri]|nr:hypothetical protein DMUE_4352 [Dictyocoela muelleri]
MVYNDDNRLPENENNEFIDDWNSPDSDCVKKYYARMNEQMCVHKSKYDFEIGDFVKIKKDFGTNPSLKLDKFESIFGKAVKITKILYNERVEVSDENGEVKTFKM